jgi:hypothetical protein
VDIADRLRGLYSGLHCCHNSFQNVDCCLWCHLHFRLQVWTLPIELAVFLLRRVNSKPAEALSSWHDSVTNVLDTEQVWTLLVKLLLSAVTLAVVRMAWALAQGLGVLALLSGATQRAAGKCATWGGCSPAHSCCWVVCSVFAS